MKKIAFISQPEYFRFIYEHDLDDIFEVREFPYHFNTKESQLNALINFNADYNIFFRGEFFPNNVLQQLEGKKIALSSEPFPRKINGKWEYTLDSIKRYLDFRNIRGKDFDYVFHYDISSKELFQEDGLGIFEEFVFPVARKTYFPIGSDKKWDIFFIGRSTNHREKFFGPLKHHFNFLHIAHGVHGSELVDYMSKSSICLNAHAEDETSWEPRMQMMLASGAFVMSEKLTPNSYLRPNIDYIEYSTPQDLFEKANYYLAHPDERETIISNAQKSINTYFDSKKIFVEFFEKIDTNDFQKFNSKNGHIIFYAIDIFRKCLSIDFSSKKLQFYLIRTRSLFKNTTKEFKRNGAIGVIRRALNTFGISSMVDRLTMYWSRLKRSLLRQRTKIYGKETKIAYVIPGVKISGGVAIVLHHVNYLKKRGYDVQLLTFSREIEIDWLANEVPIQSVLSAKRSDLAKIDVMIATHWSTAFWVDLSVAPRRMYFVQSDERRFNPENKAEINSITTTYQMDFEFITEAKWIQSWLKDEFNKDAYYVPNGLDQDIFYHDKSIEKNTKKPRVLLEGPIDFWFKGMENVYQAVKNLDCELWIISSHGKPKSNWRYDKFFENVPLNQMREIYTSCDIFLKMSYMEGFFGPPMEAMACGCAVVVGKVTGYDEYIVDGYNALVVEQGDVEGARKAVERLMRDFDLRKRLIENGQKTAKEWSWDRSIDLLEKVIAGEKPKQYYADTKSEVYNYRDEIRRLAYIQKQRRG